MQDKDLIYKYLEKNLEKKLKDVKYNLRKYDFPSRFLTNSKINLQKINPSVQKEIIFNISNFNPNQFAVFLESFKYSINYRDNFNSLLQTTKDIKAKRFPKNISSSSIHINGCIETYLGFMRALKADTLYTDKVNIDGKLKRVFIKTPIGNTSSTFNAGFFKLLIDPETMNVYSFVTTKSGKISSSLFKAYSKKDLDKVCDVLNQDNYAKFVEKNYLNFRKELLNKIDNVYGLEKVINTYLKMGGKLDPNKYKNKDFKVEMIEHLEEKLGTEKLLKIVKSTKDPKVIKQLEKEIIIVLSKKYGKEYKKVFSKNIKKTFKKKPKPLNIKRI